MIGVSNGFLGLQGRRITLPGLSTLNLINAYESDGDRKDASGNGNHGVLKSGRFVSFDGTDDYTTAVDAGTVKTLALVLRAGSTTEQVLQLNGSASLIVSSGTLTATGWAIPTIYVDGAAGSSISADTIYTAVITSDTGISASAFELGRISTAYGDVEVAAVATFSGSFTAEQAAAFDADPTATPSGATRTHFWRGDQSQSGDAVPVVLDYEGSTHLVVNGAVSVTGQPYPVPQVVTQGHSVRSVGNIESAPEDSSANHIYTSEETITLNTTADPFGGTAADTISLGGNGYVYKTASYAIASKTLTFSVYLKADAPVSTVLRINDANSGSDQTKTLMNVTTEWQRFSVTRTFDATNNNGVDFGVDQRSVVGGPATAATFFAYGWTVNEGSTSNTYIPGLTAALTQDDILVTATPGDTTDVLGETVTNPNTGRWINGSSDPNEVVEVGRYIGDLPGDTLDRLETPSSAANSITGDIDIAAYVQPDTWVKAESQRIVAKREGTSGASGAAYDLYINQNSNPVKLGFYTGGSFTSNVGFSATDSVGKWVRVTRDASTGVVRFYTSDDVPTIEPSDVTWTQLGTGVSGASGALNDVSTPVYIGALKNGSNTTAEFVGTIHRVTISNEIGGAAVNDCNPTLYQNGNSFTATTGEEWTANGNASFDFIGPPELDDNDTINLSVVRAGNGTLASKATVGADKTIAVSGATATITVPHTTTDGVYTATVPTTGSYTLGVVLNAATQAPTVYVDGQPVSVTTDTAGVGTLESDAGNPWELNKDNAAMLGQVVTWADPLTAGDLQRAYYATQSAN